MQNSAIIPARSGSKGLKDKNIKELNGKPLIGYSIDAAEKSGVFSEIMVSTDSNEYADIAVKFGASVPFLRSNKMSSDNSSSFDVIVEVLENYKKKGQIFDTVCLLQPTSPLRTSCDIVDAYKLIEKKGDSVTSVCEVDHPIKWTMELQDDLSLNEFNRQCEDVPRQKLGKYYRLNGAIYIRKVDYNEDEIKLLNNDDYAFIMDRGHSIDIDTQDDFDLAEFYMNRC